MAKTKKELDLLKNEFETLSNKLQELSEDELEEVFGGTSELRDPTQPMEQLASIISAFIGGKKCPYCNAWFAKKAYDYHISVCNMKPKNN